MPRYKLVVEYDGSPFRGWQRQTAQPSVQGAIESAVKRFSGETAGLTCAGRTDTGVHATHQVAHLDLAKAWRTDVVRDALNAHLRPNPVAILSAEIVDDTFNARHSAIRRHYRYRILNRRSPPVLNRAQVWQVPWPLDVALMRAAAALPMGLHDEIVVATSARAFLHHQVRSMVGTLMLAGSGRLSADDVADILASRDRSRCGPLAPACGLTLVGVDYTADPSGFEAPK